VAFHTHEGEWKGEWVQPLKKDELQNDFAGWGQNVTKIIEVSEAWWWKYTADLSSSFKHLTYGQFSIIRRLRRFIRVDCVY
jgi:hypothetical protein